MARRGISGWGVDESGGSIFASRRDIVAAAPKRRAYSSKRDNGTVVVIGGSEAFSGAPALASNSAYSTLAAMRVGAGYAVAYVPKSVLDVNRETSPSVIVKPLKGRNLSAADLPALKAAVDGADSVVVGPGIGRSVSALVAAAKIAAYASRADVKTVIDADAIHAVALHKPKLGASCLITPNDSEFARLSGRKPDPKSLPKRTEAAIALALRLGTSILLKGHETVVTDGRRTKVVRSRSSSLATMGTGDVLSGIIAGYAASGSEVFTAGVAGAYLHSRIGDLLYSEMGNHIIASDVVDAIPRALKRIGRD